MDIGFEGVIKKLEEYFGINFVRILIGIAL